MHDQKEYSGAMRSCPHHWIGILEDSGSDVRKNAMWIRLAVFDWLVSVQHGVCQQACGVNLLQAFNAQFDLVVVVMPFGQDAHPLALQYNDNHLMHS